MDTFTVPCTRCNEFKAKFEAEGFVVSGCDPDATKPGMCMLKYERPTKIPASPPTANAPSVPPATAAGTTTNAKAAAAVAAVPTAAPENLRYVNVTALNLRSTPSSSTSDNVLLTLTLGQPVQLTGDQQSGWWPVKLAEDHQHIGFVRALIDTSNGIGTPSLRLPVSDSPEALVAEAVRQWEQFKFGQGKEAVAPFDAMIGTMWQALKLPHDGRDDIPWSAAFISYIVRLAGAKHAGYNAFRFAASHSKYIHDAIVRAGKPGAPFHGVRLFERQPSIGDLVARSREDKISFEQAATSDAFKSHTDLIVAIHADAIYAIGGNVSNSVSVTRYPKTDNGFVSDATGAFALLVNQVV